MPEQDEVEDIDKSGIVNRAVLVGRSWLAITLCQVMRKVYSVMVVHLQYQNLNHWLHAIEIFDM